MKPFTLVAIALLISLLALPLFAGAALREVIVSHTDGKSVLQLYRMKEDGTGSRQLTQSKHGCRQPSCSPDGKKLAYVEQVGHGLAIRISDPDGQNVRTLIKEGMNLIPSWLPNSEQLVWMKVKPQPKQDPAHNAQIHIVNVRTGKARRLFTDKEQLKHSNAMPVVSPQGDRIAFVSNRSGDMRVWVSALDGSGAKLVSKPEMDYHEQLKAPIEQKVPAWSPDGKWLAHWEGVEMIHMSQFTGVPDPRRDQMIASTFHVWVVGSDGKKRRKTGRGDDPTWSPDGFVTRAFPDPNRGGPVVMVESASGEQALPIVPPKRNWGRFTWMPLQPKKKDETRIPKVASYEGRIRATGFDFNFRKVTGPTEMIIKTQADYESFVAKIPKRTISKTNPAPPSKDPLLKKPPIDFGKHMMLVAVRADSMYINPKLEFVVAEKNALIVRILDPDLGDTRFANQMQGIGTYLAVVVPKRKGPIQFLRKKGKAVPR
jgi:Tol biopolymer transport system component